MRPFRLTIEAAVVGIIFAALFAVCHPVAAKAVGHHRTLSRQCLATAVAAGVFGHVGFEVSGVNAWYAEQYEPLLLVLRHARPRRSA